MLVSLVVGTNAEFMLPQLLLLLRVSAALFRLRLLLFLETERSKRKIVAHPEQQQEHRMAALFHKIRSAPARQPPTVIGLCRRTPGSVLIIIVNSPTIPTGLFPWVGIAGIPS